MSTSKTPAPQALSEELRRQLDYYLGESQRKIAEVWAELTEQQIWHRPNEQCLAPANQLLHLTGNMRQWVGTALRGLPEIRQRDAEFAARADGSYGKDAIYEAFDRELAALRARLMQATEWAAQHRIQGHATTELGIWVHQVEHLSYHTGQLIYTVKALTGCDFDFYGDWELG